ncbi:MAG TPA: hypothetical protein VFH88_08830 [Candidatus Krumholzibacteria bacterium]|nr:hypothetical protein [Candidatus Krumholzibacteria bacterium]
MCAAALSARAQPVRYNASTWGEVSDTLRTPRAGARIALKSPFLVPGSVVVRVNGEVLAPERYQVNLHLGTIRFLDDLPAGAVVVVSYQRKPLLMAPVYSLRPAEVSAPDSTGAVPERIVTPRAPEPEAPPGLSFGGTKSVSFSTGTNRGSTLDQSLEATIEGQLTPTLKVRAILSDNNLPIQPEGNTEELQYFDRVFVEMEGPNARATVGDLTLDNKVSTFSPLSRQLRGIAGSAWNQRGRVSAAAAETKGEFRSMQFRGTTGLQGPYALLSQGRTTNDVIIAGTERVYVDGTRLQRGQNQDYVIDYDAGTITFTPRRLITTDTEIAVDFEVTAQRYARSTVMASGEKLKLGGGMDLSLLFARETDDNGSPKNITLTDADRKVIAAAGDDPRKAVTGGITQTTVGQGQYVRVPADSLAGTPAYYRFDELQGDYQVAFVEVGTGNGDYRRAGISTRGTPYFEFVGVGQGTYRTGRLLPLPESSDVYTARLERPNGAFTMDGEWNLSDHDANTLSALDDNDNLGTAAQLHMGLRHDGTWRVGLAGAGSYLEDTFHSFDRVRPGYYYRDWNLEDVPLVGTEKTAEVSADVARARLGATKYTLGRLQRDQYQGWKHEFTLQSGTLDDRGVALRGLQSDMSGTDTDRTRRFGSADLAYGFWHVVPSVTVGGERYRNAIVAAPDSGRAYSLYSARLSSRGGGRLTWRLGSEQRKTDAVDPATDKFVPARTDRTVDGTLSYHGTGATQGEIQVIHRREKDDATGSTRDTDLARLKGSSAWDGAGLRVDADYEVSQNDAVQLQRSVVFVGDGKGDYNELGEAVGKGKGSYTVLFLPTNDATPVHTVGFNMRLVWKPAHAGSERGGVTGWVLRNVSLDQTLGVREESTYEPAWKVYAMVPSALQRDSTTVFGTTTLRQDWSLLDGYRNLSLTFRYLREDTEDNRFEGVHENTFNGEQSLRFSRSLSAQLTATVEGGRNVTQRGGEGLPVGTGSTYNVEAWSVLVGAGIMLRPGANLDLDVRGQRQQDAESGAGQRTIKFQPRLVWRVADQINVFGTYELAEVRDDADNPPIRPIVFAREGRSHQWSLTPNFRVSKIISIYATYSGRNEEVFSGKRVTEHNFRLETRAYF